MKPKSKQGTEAKHWVFTWNDKNDELTHEDIIKHLSPACEYMVFQQEEGAEKTKHYQGYCEFRKPVRLTAIAKLTAPFKPHWEKRKGTREQARDYASKDETRIAGPWEAGSAPWRVDTRKDRNEMAEMVEMIKTGKSDADLLEAFPATTFKYVNNLQKVRHILKPQRTTELEVVLLVGPPGVGKTRHFWDNFPNGWAVPVGKDLWFTGYQGEKEVLIDDFAGNIGLTQLLQILDRYPVSLPSKGSHVWWCPDMIVITSNVHPCNWYDYTTRTSSYEALERRIKHVCLCKHGEDMQETDVHNYFHYQKEIGHYNKTE